MTVTPVRTGPLPTPAGPRQDERRVSDADAGDVGDGVVVPGRHPSNRDAEIAQSRSWFGDGWLSHDTPYPLKRDSTSIGHPLSTSRLPPSASRAGSSGMTIARTTVSTTMIGNTVRVAVNEPVRSCPTPAMTGPSAEAT